MQCVFHGDLTCSDFINESPEAILKSFVCQAQVCAELLFPDDLRSRVHPTEVFLCAVCKMFSVIKPQKPNSFIIKK